MLKGEEMEDIGKKDQDRRKPNLIEIEKNLNERMQNKDYQRAFFEDPLTALSQEGISLPPEKQKELFDSINSFIGKEKEVPGSILVKGDIASLSVQIHRAPFENEANFMWRKDTSAMGSFSSSLGKNIQKRG